MIVQFLREVIQIGVWVFAAFMFVLLLIAALLGFLLGARRVRRAKPQDREHTGISTLTSGMLGLMAFLLALSISFGQSRFEARRQTTVAEANTIGTAWLRTGLADAAGPALAKLIKTYAETRLAYMNARTPAEAAEAVRRTNALQTRIWQQALAAAKTMPPPLASLLINSLNDMIDASLVQRYALESRIPVETSMMLLVAALLTVGALGYQMGISGRAPTVLAFLLLVMLSAGMGLVVDFSQPRRGFTTVDTAPLVWTIQGFGAS